MREHPKVIKITLGKHEVLINRADIKNIDIYNLSISTDGYVVIGKKTQLHRKITNCPDNMEVDHINRNPLDNRRENLRVCTHSQNCMNRPKQSNNTTGYKGVTYRKRDRRYEAQIKAKGKKYWLGSFTTAEEASQAYKEAATRHHGQFMNKEDA